MIRGGFISFAATLLALPIMAHAEQVSESSVRLTFDVEATIAPRCGFDSSAVSSQLSTFMAGAQGGDTRQLQFGLSCNTPFTIRVQSRNGGLEAALGDEEALAMMQGEGFATHVDYAISLDVPLTDLNGNNVIGTATCASATLLQTGSLACPMATSNGVAFSGTSDTTQAKLTVKLDQPTKTLIAGAYTDYLTIDVGFVL
jgi:hypothetical protein